MLRAVIDHMVRDVEQLLPEGNVPWAQRLLLRNTLQV